MAFGTETRAVDGCIVQFVRGDGERRTVVVSGPAGFIYRVGRRPDRRSGVSARKSPLPGVDSALRAAIEKMEAWPGEWKVEVISTPSSILADLRGSRVQTGPSRTGMGGSDDRTETRLLTYEALTLSRIRRLDLLVRTR